MFSAKQSDIFYNDETKEMFVCTVSSISADRCDGSDDSTVYGAVPLIYKIDKNTNYKSRVYPEDLTAFELSASDLFDLTPTCPEGTNFNSITKPLINYNKTTARYSVTFLGRYSADTEGLGINNYIFKHVDTKFHLLDSNVYIPKSKFTDDQFTFENGHLNSDLYIVGNTIRNDKPSWFNPVNVEVERSTDYQIAPMYVQATSSLGFNLALGNTNVAVDNLSGNVAFPFMYSGGFISYNPKYTAYDPEYTIRVDFRARSFNVPSPTAYASSQSTGQSATRWIQQYAPAGAGEGFCVSFFKNPPKNSYIIPNGIGSTLGYAKALFSTNEVAGTAQETDGLYVHNNWNPYTGIKADDPGKYQITSNIGSGNLGSFGPAESFLGIGFDIGGNFASTSEDKPGWFNGTSYTATPCSIGIRGSSYYNTQVLTSFAMNTVAASSVPMHTSAADAVFVDYRIDLSNKGTKVTLYNKLTSATDYNTIAEYRLNHTWGSIGEGNVGDTQGGSVKYQPWYGMQSEDQKENNILPPLNVGLSFTTSTNVSRFELHKFEVTGVVVKNPWEEKEVQKPTTGVTKKIDYLQESSKNLRKKLLNVESEELVDVEMIIPAKDTIANTLSEEINRPQITLCDGSNPEIIEDDADIKISGINSDQVDKIIQVAERGKLPKTPSGVTTIKRVGRDLEVDAVWYDDGVVEIIRWDSWLKCRIPNSGFTYPVEEEVRIPMPSTGQTHQSAGLDASLVGGTAAALATQGKAKIDESPLAWENEKAAGTMSQQGRAGEGTTTTNTGGVSKGMENVLSMNIPITEAAQETYTAPPATHTGRAAWCVLTDRKYTIWVQVLVLDKFAENHDNDYNDWFVAHPFGGKEPERGRGGSDSLVANNILKSIIKAFIQLDKPDPNQLHYALQWSALPEQPTALVKNELLTRKREDGSFYIGSRPADWVENFKQIGFMSVPMDNTKAGGVAIKSGTLVPGTEGTEFFGDTWACAATWELPADSRDGDPIHKGIKPIGEPVKQLQFIG